MFYVDKINFAVLFDFKEYGKKIVDFSNRQVEDYTDQTHNYYFSLDVPTMALLFRDRHIDFETYFLSCRFSCGRNPDTYNEALFTLLKYFDTKRFAISERIYGERQLSSGKTFVRKYKDKTYEIQKYCPHMFADLEQVGHFDDDGNFCCPLHGWKFTCTGECVNKDNFHLAIREIK